MANQIVIAGGGIGGLAAALAAARAGWEPRVLEQAATFSEVGAGIQLGPNTSSILQGWGLLDGDLIDFVARPTRLCVRDARSGQELAAMPLAGAFEQRYGAPYLTVHRADLQFALLRAAHKASAVLTTGAHVVGISQQPEAVVVGESNGATLECDALVAADGVWSRLRDSVVPSGPPAMPTGHVAFRALLRQAELPAALRSTEVTLWLAPSMHLVCYPVRAGDWLNVVCVIESRVPHGARGWEEAADLAELEARLPGVCAALRERIRSVPRWGSWVLYGRAPVAGPQQMAAGRVALLGDAAHPMLPYLAQGAGMALEDARELQRVLTAVKEDSMDVPTALQRYALNRWQRCARVQARSRRNGTIFHADGPLRLARNLALRTLGERILDVPWLYGGGSG